jgi:hypothetical protein
LSRASVSHTAERALPRRTTRPRVRFMRRVVKFFLFAAKNVKLLRDRDGWTWTEETLCRGWGIFLIYLARKTVF